MEALKAVGVDEVLIYCVNDAAVMGSWEKDQKCDEEDFIKFVGDPSSALTSALDMEMVPMGPDQDEIEGIFGPYFKGLLKRCKRHALYVKDGEIKVTKVAQAITDPAGDDFPEVTLAPALIEDIKAMEDPNWVPPEEVEVMDPNEEIPAAIASDKVVVFSKDYCEFCKKTKALLNDKGVKFTTVEVNVKPNGADFAAALSKISGQKTFPNVYIGGKQIGGNDDMQAANDSGKLDELLKA